jgi:hypothetical protein
MYQELKDIAPRKFSAALSGAVPTLSSSNGVLVGDFVVDTDTNNVWQCLDTTPSATVYVQKVSLAHANLTNRDVASSHPASAISFTDTELTSTTAQAGIVEVNTKVLTSSGVINKPTFTTFVDTGTPKVTISSFSVKYYADTNFTGPLLKYTIAEATYTLTDNATNYIIFDGTTQTVQALTSRDTINQSIIIPIVTIYVDTTNTDDQFYVLDWDELAKGLPNKLTDRLVRTERFAVESGMMIGESAGRIITSTEGYVWTGATRHLVEDIASDVDHCKLYYHSSGNWAYTDITQYNNFQYDDGTDLQSLSGANRYAVNWVFVSVSDTHSCMAVVLGDQNYNLSNAEASQVPTVPAVISSNFMLIGRIIVKNGQATATRIQSAFDTVFNRTPVTEHNELSDRDATACHPATAISFTDTEITATTVQAAITEVKDKNYITGVAGEELVIGDVVYLKSDGKFWKADGTAEATAKGLIGMSTSAVSAEAACRIMLYGIYTTAGLTTAAEYYLDTTAGTYSTTKPSVATQIVRLIGYAVSTTVLLFDPDKTYIEVA